MSAPRKSAAADVKADITYRFAVGDRLHTYIESIAGKDPWDEASKGPNPTWSGRWSELTPEVSAELQAEYEVYESLYKQTMAAVFEWAIAAGAPADAVKSGLSPHWADRYLDEVAS